MGDLYDCAYYYFAIQLEIDVSSVQYALCMAPKLKLKPKVW